MGALYAMEYTRAPQGRGGHVVCEAIEALAQACKRSRATLRLTLRGRGEGASGRAGGSAAAIAYQAMGAAESGGEGTRQHRTDRGTLTLRPQKAG